MKRPLGHAVILYAILFFGCARTGVSVRQTADGPQGIDSTANRELEAVLQQYVRAVNDADRELLREIWDPGDGASYINPTQRLWTWDELAGFWQGFLGNSFSARQFKPDSVVIRRVGDVAWIVFNWEFTATRRNGQPYQSRGWETQVYRKTDRGWRIAHAHYSARAPGQ